MMPESLKVWLVKEGEALPTDEGEQRLLRMGLIGEEFNKVGADIVWFASTFDHNLKKYRANHTIDIPINAHYSVCLLHGRRYKKNLSLRRILHFMDERKQFRILAETKEKPDVIVAAMPNIDLAFAAVKYGKEHNIPVFVDVRDMWPELYEDYFPRFKTLVHYAIIPFKKQLSWTLKNATGILGTSEKFLDWALKYAGREKGSNDSFYYVSYPDTNVELTDYDFQHWYNMGLSEDDLICCFFGQFGYAVDLEKVMYAALNTAKKNSKIKYVICGMGEKLESYKQILNGAENVIFPGWVDRKQICTLGKIASVGLLSYRENKNFEWSMPNKFCEYLALGLTVAVEPMGMMADFTEENQIGFRYENEYDLAEKLLYMADHRDDVSNMKKRARDLYERQFMSDVVYKRLVADIRRIIGK